MTSATIEQQTISTIIATGATVNLSAESIDSEELMTLLDYTSRMERKGDSIECDLDIENADETELEMLQGLIVTHDIRNFHAVDAVVTTEAA